MITIRDCLSSCQGVTPWDGDMQGPEAAATLKPRPMGKRGTQKRWTVSHYTKVSPHPKGNSGAVWPFRVVLNWSKGTAHFYPQTVNNWVGVVLKEQRRRMQGFTSHQVHSLERDPAINIPNGVEISASVLKGDLRAHYRVLYKDRELPQTAVSDG